MSQPRALVRLNSAMDLSMLYEEHAERVLVFFARRTVDPEVAVDLTAETFAQAIKSRNRYRGTTDEEAVAWLFSIARHQLGSYLRRGRAEQRALRRLGIRVPRLEEEDIRRIEELADLRDIRRALGQQVARLPCGHRDALRLRVLDELPYSEVARRLDVSEATARARVSRALRQLASSVELAALWRGAAHHE
jgi:RNA polymerase sigma factor (sigma-70 family)